MTASNIFNIFRRGWWVIFLTAAIAVGAAFVYTQRTARVLYRSSTRVVVSPNTTLSDEADLMRSLDSLSRGMIIPTFAEIYQSNRVLQSSLQAANLSSDNRSYKISAYNLPETNILVLSVTGPDAGITQLLTYEISHLGQEMITEIYPMYTITTLEDPNFPSTPIGSGSQRNLVMATFLGAGLGLAVAVLIYGDLGAILGFSR